MEAVGSALVCPPPFSLHGPSQGTSQRIPQDNCKLGAHSTGRFNMALGRYTPWSPRGEVPELLDSSGFLLPSVLPLIFLCFLCKTQTFPGDLPKDALVELCPSLVWSTVCYCAF